LVGRPGACGEDPARGDRVAPGSHPYLGRTCNQDLRPGLRSFTVGEYIIIYRIEDEDVVILRVVRDSRDLQALFLN
jgi:plasmid stabilization system protein ParE